jgi:hypothetical protein
VDILRIALTQGQFATVDAADGDAVRRHRWHAVWIYNCFYAATVLRSNKRRTYLHRFLMQPPDGMEVDHINGDPLDNRRANLRVVTHGENLRNQKLRTDSKSGFKGVSFDKDRGTWYAYVNSKKARKFLGRFATALEAAHAYNVAARQLHGEHARLNNI